MKLTSPAFKNGENIPTVYTCDGDDINPSLVIGEIPEGTRDLVLIVDDPDAPSGTWVHWVVFNIPLPAEIKEKSVPGTQGLNSFKRLDYGGPCPPAGSAHRYFFKLYALDQLLDLAPGASKKEVEKAMQGHILAGAELMGFYQR